MSNLIATLLLVSTAHAYSGGKTGSSTSGCGDCHDSADATTSVTFHVASTSVAPGDTIPVQMLVASTSSSRSKAGLDVSATGGTLSAGPNTRESGGEITHSDPVAGSGGSTTFVFQWTAPDTPGTYTLNGAGNAVNDNGSDSGDGWNLGSIAITVEAAATGGGADTGGGKDTGPDAGTDSGAAAGDTGADEGGGDADSGDDAGAGSGDAGDDASDGTHDTAATSAGCDAAGTGAGVWALLVAAAGLRRRASRR